MSERDSGLPLPAPQHEHRLLGLLLLTLHLALWLPGWPAHLLATAHFLLFLLWQPSWGRAAPFRHLALFLLFAAAFVAVPAPWLWLGWETALLGLLAGREPYRLADRLANLAGRLFLLAHILALDLDAFFHLDLYSADTGLWLRAGLLAPPLALLAVGGAAEREYARLDFFHGLVHSLLVTVVALGSLVGMYALRLDSYPLALGFAALAALAGLLATGWLWLAFAGFDDWGELWGRAGLDSGSAFEQWLANLTHPATYKSLNPEQFLHTALEQVVALPWISGIAWQSPYGEGALGQAERHSALISVQSLDVTVYARRPIRGNRYAHVKLLIQLIEHFHQAKRREQAFSQQAHLKAIHETGAKLTHDIKNLLQSLHAITSAMQSCQQPEQFGETQRLLQGQLPHLSQRLQRTLEKLKQPDQPSYTQVPIRTWWDNLRARYRKREVDFSMSIMWNANIPEELFDNVVENLLENALNKRNRETGLRIHVALASSEAQIRLTVCDDGSPVPPDIEKRLLTEPVSSRDGYGIGLYQVAKQVIQSGYRLNLSHNLAGQVCFELSSV